MTEYVSRDEIEYKIWDDICETESHHDHKIVRVDGRLRWEQTLDYSNIDINKKWEDWYKAGLTKNSEEPREFCRSIGYSLYGYWELFYWEGNNPNVMDYKQP